MDTVKSLFFKFIFDHKMRSVSRNGDSFVYWAESEVVNDLRLTPKGLLDLAEYFDEVGSGEISIYSLGITSFPTVHLIKIDLFTRVVTVVVEKDAEIAEDARDFILAVFVKSKFTVLIKNAWSWKGYLI